VHPYGAELQGQTACLPWFLDTPRGNRAHTPVRPYGAELQGQTCVSALYQTGEKCNTIPTNTIVVQFA